MRAFGWAVLHLLVAAVFVTAADLNEALQIEWKGDPAAARQLLRSQVSRNGLDPGAALHWAQFGDLHRDPGTRVAYRKALQLVGSGASAQAAARRLLELDLLAGDRDALAGDYKLYQASGAAGLMLPNGPATRIAPLTMVSVPGPLRSFARMAALAPDGPPSELLAALARNIVTSGYQASGGEGLEATEYLKLINRYLSQARELEQLSGSQRVIHIAECDSAQAGDLLRILGYRIRGGCGGDLVLETVNASRAFLAVDSGFPVVQLEKALRTNAPFDYDYHPAQIPVLYGADYWVAPGKNFIDEFLGDPALARFYLALSRLDPETADALRTTVAASRLKAYAHVIDFYGGMFAIRGGKAVLPGGAEAAKGWTELVGASPENGAAFFDKLISKDDGWLASYYDSLARLDQPVRDYLQDGARMKRFYTAVHGRISSPGPARPVFRSNTEMVLLTARLRLDANGQIHIPGSLETWRNLFEGKLRGKTDARQIKQSSQWKEADDVLEGMFAMSRKAVDNIPLRIFLILNDIDRRRTEPLKPATVERLADDYTTFSSQYPLFVEFPLLADETIVSYLDTAAAIGKIRDVQVRADAAGLMQSLTGLWQIAARQDLIEQPSVDKTLRSLLSPFVQIKSEAELFTAGRNGVSLLLTAVKSPEGGSAQERMLDLLAGSTRFEDEDAHRLVINQMQKLFDQQRLVSLKTLFEVADHLEAVSKGAKLNPALVSRSVARITEVQLPRATLSSGEKSALNYGYWTEKHIERERQLNLRQMIEKSNGDAQKVLAARAELTPLLRDTLVGFNYIHYAPPGAEILQTNPLFVRSHDFIGPQGTPLTWKTTEVYGSGWPASAGGRLQGSMVNLPYALAEAEQNFLIPTREQALIWGDLVPQMLVASKVPRFWNVTHAQTHWVHLHLLAGESLLAAAALSPAVMQQVAPEYERIAPPARSQRILGLVREGNVKAAVELVTPAELFALAMSQAKTPGNPLLEQIRTMSASDPERLNYRTVGRHFGTPKLSLAGSFSPELQQTRTYPTLMGYSSRLLAESWESSMLYYAGLSDELQLSPAQLNVSVPAWTQETLQGIFATNLDDWPALLRSLRVVGEQVRAENRKRREAERASIQ